MRDSSPPSASSPPLVTSLLPSSPPSRESASTPLMTSQLHWVDLCPREEVSEIGLFPTEVDRGGAPYPLLLIRTGTGLYALHDECPHRHIPISESGYLDGDVVHCGWHHWGFSVETGAHIIPTGNCVPTFPLREEGEMIQIALPW